MNIGDLLCILFLGFGMVDGYHKGFVKKGLSLLASIATLLIVYISCPYVAQFIEGILPDLLPLEQLAGADSELYMILMLTGLEGEAEHYVRLFVARILAFVVTYIVIRLAFRIAMMFLQMLVKVPVISFTNRLFGAGIGIVQQLLLVWIFLLLLPVFSLTPVWDSLYETVQQGALLGYLYDHNLLLLIGILFLAKL